MVALNLGDTRLIITECQRRNLLRNQTAYVLATTYWETGRTMKPVREKGGEAYLKSKKYYPYVGMGYVQLTWERNYRDWSQRLGVDFIKNPKLLLEPEYAVRILVDGMRLGTFTGKKLGDYITLKKSDFVNARRIVNGTDKAQEIAKIAKEYDAALLKEGYGVESKPATTAPSQPSDGNSKAAGVLAAILAAVVAAAIYLIKG